MGRGMNYCQDAGDLGEFRNRKIKVMEGSREQYEVNLVN